MRKQYLSEIASVLAAAVAVVAMSTSIFKFDKFDDMKLAFAVAAAAAAYAGFFSVYLTRMRERRLRQKRVFLIYSRKDKESVSKLVKLLKERGYNPWFDVEEISPGQKWAPSVLKGLTDSAVALLVVSKNLDLSTGFVAQELKTAMASMRSRDEAFSPVIPVRLDDSPVPDEVKEVHWVDLDGDKGLEQLDIGRIL